MTGNRRYSGRNKSLYVTYRCFTHRDSCINKEINRYYLEDVVLDKIKEYFFYKSKVQAMYNKINTFIEKNSLILQDEIANLTNELLAVNESSANITKAIEQGMYLDDIFVRLDELETKKQELQEEIAKKVKMRDVRFSDDDIDNTISQCKQLLKQPTNPANRDFIKKAVVKIVVYRDEVLVVLNTGLSVNDEFNTEIKFTRKEIYDFGRRIKNAG